MSNTAQLSETQYAVQLIGPSELCLNRDKEVFRPTGYQILGKVEATGLCFSDLKLLKQFQDHPRKAPVISGMDLNEIEQIPSYVPHDKPTVPGHETVIRIVAVGDKVRRHKVGERCLVQTDYRGLPSSLKGNASFGYNFEGGLQEYVLIDERVSRDFETDESFLLPAREDRSAAAIALVEPWACVEDSYQNPERQCIKAGGHLLVVADPGHSIKGLKESFPTTGNPASITIFCPEKDQSDFLKSLGIPVQMVDNIESISNSSFDDIVYFGTTPETIEALASKPGDRCIVNIVTGGKQIGRPVQIGIGRVHYGQHRWIGTTGDSAADSYRTIPVNGEIQDGDRCLVIGAGGPMGQMHIIRDVCSGAKDLKVFGTDFDDARLASLSEIAAPLARQNNVELVIANPSKSPLEGTFSYIAIMVPIAPVVSDAIVKSMPGARINIFAGIPAPTIHPIDLDMLIAKRCFLFGTSGSVLRDMKIMLEKVESGQLDTNLSVDAVSGMEGAIAGIEAVENRTLAGKIIVYPQLHDMPLIPLSQLENTYPTVAAKLRAGRWTKAAEEELLRVAAH
jgi:threonine dehydrogenase-like Zn-dependent dehydrogenase